MSAYEDKFKSSRDVRFRFKRQRVVQNYGDLTFGSFIQYVLDELRKFCSLPSCKVNHHWQPFYDQCGFCDLSYDVIGFLNEFQNDISYIKKRIQRPDIFNITIRANSSPQTTTAKSIQEKTFAYFKELKPNEKTLLMKYYNIDFEMFGFDKEKYM